ncbi:MAG: ABC transporter ATP-binding protein [Firmicutes bacterium]|nr:ABC transporter ATP-binding protein [Bacillota bacterium]
MLNKQPAVELKGITKTFPGVVANDGINIKFHAGEVHALLGENGAGKTTLMNILYGLYPPDSGEILIEGIPHTIASPLDALKLGIGMVHQHFMLVHPFTVAENIVLGEEPSQKRWFLDMKRAVRDVEKLSAQYGFQVDPNAKVQDISVGMQQRVEILKALYRGAEVLILDEPTAVLTPQEVEELRQITDNLAKTGKTIIFITHKLQEVMAMSQRITVIQKGRVIDTVRTDSTGPVELARMMVGRDVVFKLAKKEQAPGSTVLRLENVHAEDERGLDALKGIDLEIRRGEIVGIAGIDGNGQRELAEVLIGARRVNMGRILFNGQDVTAQGLRTRRELGISSIPEDRRQRGLILDFSLAENAVLGKHHQTPFRKGIRQNIEAVREYGCSLLARYDVRSAGISTTAGSLSGGNQQKLVVGRELDSDPDILVAAQPTRGLDIGAIEFVHQKLLEQRMQGKGVLLISLELEELLNLSDRLLVIYEGRLVAEVLPQDTSEGELGLLMTGGKKAAEVNRV